METQILGELEAAAQILLAPPNLVTNEQRHAAESVFLNFKKAKSPYVMCKQILENTKVDYVLFEVAGLLKTAFIRDWRLLSDTDKLSWREYLFNYVVERASLPPYVREKILQVLAIMVKMESIDDMGLSLGPFLTQVENLVATGDQTRQTLGCNVLSSIMQEFSMNKKSSDINLTWENHLKLKKTFQDSSLKRIFQFCCRALNNMMSNAADNQHSATILKSLLVLSESILTWNFISSYGKLNRVFELNSEVDENLSLRLQPSWQDVILDPQVIDLFYTVYWKIRLNPQLAHHGMTCLVQLASLDGPVFTSKEVHLQYISNFLQNFLKLVTSADIIDREALGISSIIYKVLLFYSSLLAELPSSLVQSAFEQFTKLTCDFAKGAAAEESLRAEDCLYMEGFDRIMDAWLFIFMAPDKLPASLEEQIAHEIFNVYVKFHVGPPEGSRDGGIELEPEEMSENDEDDKLRFQSQLQTIGAMAQVIPHHSLPLLAVLLEDRTRKLSAILHKLQQHPITISDNNAILQLFEDIHWLVLISGFVLSMHSKAETSTVPMQLMHYSIKQAAHMDTSLQVFGSPNQDIKAILNGETHSDHVLRLVAAVFRLCHTLKEPMTTKLLELLSPTVTSDVLWFLQRWSATYLFLDEEFYSDLSPVLTAAHGRDSEGAIWALQFLLDQAIAQIVHFHAEAPVLEETVQLLLSLVQNRDKRNAFVRSNGLSKLLELVPQLPSYVKQGIYKTLTVAGMSVEEGSVDDDYWTHLLEPLQNTFRTLICREAASSHTFQNETIKTSMLDVLQCLLGVSSGARSVTVQTIFSFIGPMLEEMPNVLFKYHNYPDVVESILTLHCGVAKCLIAYLTRTEVNEFYDTCLKLVQTYATWNGGRLNLECAAQDDTLQDVLLLLELFTELLSKDLVDLAIVCPNDGHENEPIVTASEVALRGLNLIMPIMTVELLKYPALCLKYYRLLYCLSETFPGKIIQLPENLLKAVFSSVELGLTSFGNEIVGPCCEFIQLLAAHICQSTPNGAEPCPVLKPFFKLVFDLILSSQINSNNVPNTSTVLFALICCYQREYERLVRDLLAAQPEEALVARLARSFNFLTSEVPLTYTRQNRMIFSTRFDRFITEAQGFLCIK